MDRPTYIRFADALVDTLAARPDVVGAGVRWQTDDLESPPGQGMEQRPLHAVVDKHRATASSVVGGEAIRLPSHPSSAG